MCRAKGPAVDLVVESRAERGRQRETESQRQRARDKRQSETRESCDATATSHGGLFLLGVWCVGVGVRALSVFFVQPGVVLVLVLMWVRCIGVG